MEKEPANKGARVHRPKEGPDCFKVGHLAGLNDIRDLYAIADEQARIRGWKEYSIVPGGQGWELYVKRTK